MTETTSFVNALVSLYALKTPPDARESGILQAQLARVGAMLRDSADPTGALFLIEPQAYASVLARLADETLS